MANRFLSHINKGFSDVFYIWKDEFKKIFRDTGVLIFFIVVPLVYPLIYGFIYTNEVVHEVPAAVVDNCRSSLSREYIRKINASPDVDIISYCSDLEEAKLMMKERAVYGIIYIPETFSKDIMTGKQTTVSVFCDMSGLMYYKAMLLANTEVSLEMNKDIKLAKFGGATARQQDIIAHPIKYNSVA